LVHQNAVSFDKLAVRGDDLPRLKEHNVPRHQERGVDIVKRAITLHVHFVHHTVLERRDGFRGLSLFKETEACALDKMREEKRSGSRRRRRKKKKKKKKNTTEN
jgi:hypothetical protein